MKGDLKGIGVIMVPINAGQKKWLPTDGPEPIMGIMARINLRTVCTPLHVHSKRGGCLKTPCSIFRSLNHIYQESLLPKINVEQGGAHAL